MGSRAHAILWRHKIEFSSVIGHMGSFQLGTIVNNIAVTILWTNKSWCFFSFVLIPMYTCQWCQRLRICWGGDRPGRAALQKGFASCQTLRRPQCLLIPTLLLLLTSSGLAPGWAAWVATRKPSLHFQYVETAMVGTGHQASVVGSWNANPLSSHREQHPGTCLGWGPHLSLWRKATPHKWWHLDSGFTSPEAGS